MVTNEVRLPLSLRYVNTIGIDIGGTLIKIVHYEPLSHQDAASSHLESGRLIFRKFEGSQLSDAIRYMLAIFETKKAEERIILATGGGAHKYAARLTERLSAQLVKLDEMSSLVAGLTFLLASLPYESYALSQPADPHSPFTYLPTVEQPDSLFPYLLVNIGSGVSILKISSPVAYERVSGSSLGGGTFLGLCSALTQCGSFDEAVTLAESGDHSHVDLLVGDIYGGMDYQKIGLSRSIIASSCAKLSPALNHYSALHSSSSIDPEPTATMQDGDIAASLLHMICNNLGQIAYLNAQRHSVKRVIFSGFFIRGQRLAMRKLSYAIDFWSKGTMSALFLKHEGYLGSLGALLLLPEPEAAAAAAALEKEAPACKEPCLVARVKTPAPEPPEAPESQGYASHIELEWFPEREAK